MEQNINTKYTDFLLGKSSRFSSTKWANKLKNLKCTIIGLGGIGSYTAYNISRLGMYIELYDDDKVDLSNYSGQLFRFKDIGKYKVNAISEIIAEFSSNYKIYHYPIRIDTNHPLNKSHVYIAGLDNMSSRKLVFEKWLELHSGTDSIFIDGRLSIDTMQIYSVSAKNENSINRYRETLFTDKEADAVICTLKQTSFMASIIGGMITNVVSLYGTYLAEPDIYPFPPFKIEFDGNNLDFKVEI